MSDFTQLVAVERGFYDGAMVEVGAKFHFATKTADGKERKLPKWAVPVAQLRTSTVASTCMKHLANLLYQSYKTSHSSMT